MEITALYLVGGWHIVTALQSRTFAIWTFLSAIVRLYCAYHIHEKSFGCFILTAYHMLTNGP